ncbi:MAG: flagellar hook-length control protein FliK [Halieaceae bacterium]|jgi:flagellar hook-length control protein FliK
MGGTATSVFVDDAAMPSLELSSSPDSPEFGEEVASKLRVFLRDGVREARLQLAPAELGRLQVTIQTDGDQARVSFMADSSAARDAIEQALPRLRDMLEQQGLQLAGVDVGQRGAAGEEQSAREQAQLGNSAVDSAVTEETEHATTPSGESSSRIDTYI